MTNPSSLQARLDAMVSEKAASRDYEPGDPNPDELVALDLLSKLDAAEAQAKTLAAERDELKEEAWKLKNECAYLKHLRSVDDLAVLVNRLVHIVRKSDPENDCANKAAAYLRQCGLAGSPLRDTEARAALKLGGCETDA